jgi:hypothetical protein
MCRARNECNRKVNLWVLLELVVNISPILPSPYGSWTVILEDPLAKFCLSHFIRSMNTVTSFDKATITVFKNVYKPYIIIILLVHKKRPVIMRFL